MGRLIVDESMSAGVDALRYCVFAGKDVKCQGECRVVFVGARSSDVMVFLCPRFEKAFDTALNCR